MDSAEDLRRRDRALGWALFVGFLLLLLIGIGLVLVAVPLFIVAFPLTLSFVAVVLAIGWLRHRRRRLR